MTNHKSNNKINKDNISCNFAVVISLFLKLFCASVESREKHGLGLGSVKWSWRMTLDLGFVGPDDETG